jgi:hypothetical protein
VAAWIRVAPDAAAGVTADRACMEIFWNVVTISLCVVIMGIVLWMLIVAPFRSPRHSGR